MSPIISSRSFDKDVDDLKSQLSVWSACINHQVMTLAVDTTLSVSRDVSSLRQVFDFTSKAGKMTAYKHKRQSLMRRLAPRRQELQATWRHERRKGTVQWLFDDPVYRSWETDTKSAALIIHGSLGSGKTVLMANLVGHLHTIASSSPSTATRYRPLIAAFFYQKQTKTAHGYNTVISSIFQQFLAQLEGPALLKCLDKIPDINADLQALGTIVTNHIPPQQICYVVLDGLEVDDTSPIGDIPGLLSDLEFLWKKLNLRICFSTRTSSDWRGLVSKNKVFSLSSRSIAMTQAEKDGELAAYISAQVDRRGTDSDLSPQLLDLIKQALAVGANGMYLWAALQLEMILPLDRKRVLSPRDIESLIVRLPPSLEEVYDSLIDQIHDLRYGSRIFQVAAAARRLLTTKELMVALNVKPGNTFWDAKNMPLSAESVVNSCGGGILEVDEEDGTVHFIHQSAILHLVGTKTSLSFSRTECEEYTRDVCITYLNLNIHDRRLVRKEKNLNLDASTIVNSVQTSTSAEGNSTLTWALSRIKQRASSSVGPQPQVDLAQLLRDIQHTSATNIDQQPAKELIRYANEYWHTHFTAGDVSPQIDLLSRKIINGELPHVERPWVSKKQGIVKWCLEAQKQDLLYWLQLKDSIYDEGDNYLDEIAVLFRRYMGKSRVEHVGKHEMIPLEDRLLSRNLERLPISLSKLVHRFIWADSGDKELLYALLDPGRKGSWLNKNWFTDHVWDDSTSLDLLMQRMLESSKADGWTDPPFKYGSTMHTLLSHNADPEGSREPSPLMLSIYKGWNRAAIALLQHGANPNRGCHIHFTTGASPRDSYATPLELAIEKENLEVIKKLLLSGASIAAATDLRRSPLMIAVWRRSQACITLLLDMGADPNAQDYAMANMTPLGLALSEYEDGDEWLIELLLEKGAHSWIDFQLDGVWRKPGEVAVGKVPPHILKKLNRQTRPEREMNYDDESSSYCSLLILTTTIQSTPSTVP